MVVVVVVVVVVEAESTVLETETESVVVVETVCVPDRGMRPLLCAVYVSTLCVSVQYRCRARDLLRIVVSPRLAIVATPR